MIIKIKAVLTSFLDCLCLFMLFVFLTKFVLLCFHQFLSTVVEWNNKYINEQTNGLVSEGMIGRGKGDRER